MAILRILFALVLVLLAPLPALAQATEPAPPPAAEPATPAAANERVTYIHTDALGSPIMGTDEQGDVIWREDYQPYGERFLGEAANTRRIYTGKYEETSTGLVDFGGRWYNPEIGRFYSVDPQGFDETNPHSFNRYAYANDNPYAFVDPDGEAPWDVVKLVPAFGASLGGLAAYTQGQLTGDAALVGTSLAGMNALMGSNIEALASLVTPPGTSRVIWNVAKGADEAIALTKARFGHTFTTHGQDATEFLTKRAAGMGKPVGQFLDDQAAARLIQENLGKLSNGAVSVPVPKGFPARVIMPDGSYAPASTIRLVPGGNGVKTAYPEL